jgi:phosphoglycerate dehydrogenase-like enzyme
MPAFHIYVTEPEAINLDIVHEALGDTEYTLVPGSPDLVVGDAHSCDTLLIRSGTTIDNTVKSRMPDLKHIVRVGVGLDNVDLAYCEKEGIAVYNAPGANAEAVAEYAVAVIMLALRNIHLLDRHDIVTWNRFKFSGKSITDQTVGIVGFGHIGKLLYGKLLALGVKQFMIYDPYVVNAPERARMSSLDDVLRHCHVISLHLPLLETTKHIINLQNLELVQQGSIILNASRGGIVDENAIVETLQIKQLTYIADTVEGEPDINADLLDKPNILVTPHIASLTDQAERAMIAVAIDNLLSGTVAATQPA